MMVSLLNHQLLRLGLLVVVAVVSVSAYAGSTRWLGMPQEGAAERSRGNQRGGNQQAQETGQRERQQAQATAALQQSRTARPERPRLCRRHL